MRRVSPVVAPTRAQVVGLATAAAAATGVWALSTCAHAPAPGAPLRRSGDEIAACGQFVHAGTPVVLWHDPGGYDAYRVEARFGGEAQPGTAAAEGRPRYGPARDGLPEADAARVLRDGWRLQDLQRVVRMLVVHYDAAGSARQCFKVLHDRRGLSVHFLLDVDGTIYQTLDLKERARHATDANAASIGIEIAHIGAFASPDDAALKGWYRHDAAGPFVAFPEWLRQPGVRTLGFLPRPARPQLLRGEIHGKTYYQYDFTAEQYRALGRLLAALHRTFPRIALAVPRAPSGAVLDRALDAAELAEFEGVLGHWHVTERKVDPGPAFDWERVLAAARAGG